MAKNNFPEEATSCQLEMMTEDGVQKVWFRRATPTTLPGSRDSATYGKQILPKGHVRREGARPLSCDILFEPDVPVTLRDGTVIYTDILRPVEDGQYPAIVGWGPFGKSLGCVRLDDFPDRAGVSLDATSELMIWESVDPAYWVEHGYAVLHPSPRGSYHSEGNIYFLSKREAEDGYDFIEWAAAQPWSNGHLGMAGNSWLAVMQWFIAAEQPPHLSAIAPWEGASDVFRDFLSRGGIPTINFPENIIKALPGEGLVEDIAKMAITETEFSGYWKDKRAQLDKVKVPAYIVASYDNFLHAYGTFDGWRNIASTEKWLRVHNTHEWPDLYDPAHTEDLRRFFDRYLKGIENGWEDTPQVRAVLLDPGKTDEVGRVIDDFPPKDYPHRTLYLADQAVLAETPKSDSASVEYPAEQVPGAVFRFKVDQESELLGYCKLKLWVEAEGADDMDLVVSLQKVDGTTGKPILGKNHFRPNEHVGEFGPVQALGMLRVSRRALDSERSTPEMPYLSLAGEQRLKPGEVVPVEIGFWPMGLKVHAGEILQLTIIPYHTQPMVMTMGCGTIEIPADRYTFDPESPPEMITLGGGKETVPSWVNEQSVKSEDRNKGVHRIHFGGQYDSHLLLPLKAV